MNKLPHLHNLRFKFLPICLLTAIILSSLIPRRLFAQSGIFAPETNPTIQSGPAIVFFKVLSILFGIIGLVILIYMLFGTYKFVSSQGKEHEVEKSKTIIIMSLIGILVVLIAYIFIRILFNAIS